MSVIDPIARALEILRTHDVTLDDEGPGLTWCVEEMRQEIEDLQDVGAREQLALDVWHAGRRTP